jgi:GNAT superfamily N-acetyltransferase
MMRADLAVVDSLRRRENWNQTARDLERFLLYEPDGCFIACWEDVPVGTVTTTAYGKDLGWIGMMLVDPDYRRRGIASALIRRSLDYLREKQVASIKLDATPAGEPVYSQLGFQPEWKFERWERPGEPAPQVPRMGQADFQPPACDARIFGADRLEWLDLLAKDSLLIQRNNAFGMLRAGSNAAYLGPIIAEEPAAAAEIIRELMGSIEGRVYWDVPGPNLQAAELARQLGFQPVRELLRMWLGAPCPGEAGRQYALADPATG